MTAHLGPRVSALLDGQLPAAEAERAWQHVYECHSCRDQVEREGWVKARLARLTSAPTAAGQAPDHLKGLLTGLTPGDVLRLLPPAAPAPSRPRTVRVASLAALGGGAVGAAVVGVLALGTAPADAPASDLRLPSTTQSPVSTTTTPQPTPSAPAQDVIQGPSTAGPGVRSFVQTAGTTRRDH